MILILGLILAHAANAFDNIKLYTGAGLDYSKYGICKNNISSKYDLHRAGGGILLPILGIKFHEHFGIEAGYSFNRKITLQKSKEAEESYKVRNYYIDLMTFLPITDQFNIIGGFGIGRLMMQKGQNVDSADIQNKFGWHVKFGIQHDFNNTIGVATVFNYQKASNRLNNVKFIKNIKSIWIAMIYTI